jgi:hypothetical protein
MDFNDLHLQNALLPIKSSLLLKDIVLKRVQL